MRRVARPRFKETLVSRSPEETMTAGARLAVRLGAGAVVGCIGELGAGKTCFLQGLARGLGVTAAVTSPTFVMVNEYRGRLPVHHLDAYRVGSLGEIADLGVEEMFHGEGVTLVEWADKLLPLLPAHTIMVTISGLGDEPRRIVLEGPAEAAGPAVSDPGH